MADPVCPNCQGPMVIRTARYGPNRGGQFWGCAAFPRCRGTHPYANEATTDDDASDAEKPSMLRPSVLPRDLQPVARAAGRTSIYHQHTYAPRSAVIALAYSRTADAIRACSHWQSEWLDSSGITTDDDQADWLPTAWKVLTRGSVVPLSPTLEAELAALLTPPDDIEEQAWVDGARQLAQLADDADSGDLANCDSNEEELFFRKVVPACTPRGLARNWHHQMPLAALCPGGSEETRSQRVDFLFSFLDRPPVVVEIDGDQHKDRHAVDTDRERDQLLEQYGCRVIRIPTREVLAAKGPAVTRLMGELESVESVAAGELSQAALWLLAGRHAMQIQSVVLHAFRDGHLSGSGGAKIGLAITSPSIHSSLNLDAIAKAAISDLNSLLKEVCDALGVPAPPTLAFVAKGKADFRIAFADSPAAAAIVRNAYLPFDVVQQTLIAGSFAPQRVGRDGTEQLFSRVFGHDAFREGQFESIERVVCGRDAIVLLPTGAGKSAIYQLAGLLRPGLTLVVSPLISLIEDQVANLRLQGVDRAVGISSRSEEPVEDLLHLLGKSQYWLCYVAPERLQMSDFRDRLRQLTTATPVSLVAVDEVHCVSEWGHDFRPSYLNLAKAAREYCAHGNVPPPIIGLTGTASRSVLKDVQRSLEIHGASAVITPQTFDRPELTFEVHKCSSREKPTVLLGVLQKLPQTFRVPQARFFQPHKEKTCAGLIFCVHVNGPFGVMEVAQWVEQNLQIPVEPYGSTTPRGRNAQSWAAHLRQCTHDFKRNTLPLMVCTTAFGMGIDKPNIRYSIHYNLPKSIESFYQEAGRTGRNRDKARCAIIWSVDDEHRADRLLSPDSSRDDVATIVEQAGFAGADDVLRNLFFHKDAFTGEDGDILAAARLVHEIGIDGSTGRATVRFDSLRNAQANVESEKAVEQAIQRLVTVGALSDYTRDYARRTFTVHRSGASKPDLIRCLSAYVSTYQKQRADEVEEAARDCSELPYDAFVEKLVAQLVSFVYEVVERGRRQALSEMLRAVRRARTSSKLREDILRYLERSRFTDMLEPLLEQEDAGVSAVAGILREVASPLDAAELRAQCARLLNDYPDQPSLRFLLAAAEAACEDAESEAVKANVLAALQDAVKKYRLPPAAVYTLLAAASNATASANASMAWAVVTNALAILPQRREALRHLLRAASPELLPIVYAAVVADLNRKVCETVG